MVRLQALLLVGIALLQGIPVQRAMALTWHVPSELPTISAGMNAASAGDTVLLACGTYYESGIPLKSGVVLSGETGLANCVTINGLYEDIVLYCCQAESSTIIQGLSITGGNAPFGGGGLYCFYASPLIQNCVFGGNSAISEDGGAMVCLHSSPTLRACIFLANSSNWGGGAVSCNQSHVQFDHCEFSYNLAAAGAAVGCSGNSLLEFRFCTFSGNVATTGAAIAIYGSTCELVNCSFAGNSAPANAVIYDHASVLQLTNCLIALNQAAAMRCAGGGPYEIAGLSCCDLYGNTGGDWTGCIAGQSGTDGNISANPRFCSSGGQDLSVSSSSVCLPQNNSCHVLIGAQDSGCAIREDGLPGSADGGCVLLQNLPNPFNPSTRIPFALASAQHACLRVYDAGGRLVATLLDRMEPAGSHEVTWNGLGADSRPAPTGIYFIRLETDFASSTRKMMLIR